MPHCKLCHKFLLFVPRNGLCKNCKDYLKAESRRNTVQEEKWLQSTSSRRLAEEAERARLAEEERIRKEAEEARKSEEERRLAEEAERARLAEEERIRKEAEEARKHEEERRLAEEAEEAHKLEEECKPDEISEDPWKSPFLVEYPWQQVYYLLFEIIKDKPDYHIATKKRFITIRRRFWDKGGTWQTIVRVYYTSNSPVVCISVNTPELKIAHQLFTDGIAIPVLPTDSPVSVNEWQVYRVNVVHLNMFFATLLQTEPAKNIPVLNEVPTAIPSLTLKQNPKESCESSHAKEPSLARPEDRKDISLMKLDLPIHTRNALIRAGIYTLGDLCKLSAEELRTIKNIGQLSVKELLQRRKKWIECNPLLEDDGSSNDENFKEPSKGINTSIECSEEGKENNTSIECPEEGKNIPLERLGLSVRAYNCLYRCEFDTLGKICALTTEDLFAIRNLGQLTINEILQCRKEWVERILSSGGDMSFLDAADEKCAEESNTSIECPEEGKAIPLERLGLSVRAYNCLYRYKFDTLGKICALTKEDLLAIKNLGQRTINEILQCREKWVKRLMPEGNGADNDVVSQNEKPENQAICAFSEYVQTFSNAMIRQVVLLRAQGKTFSEIAGQLNISVQRAQQFETRFWKYVEITEMTFPEDKYIPLLEKYFLDEKGFKTIFNEAHEVWYVVNKRSRCITSSLLPLEDALEDRSLPQELRDTIQSGLAFLTVRFTEYIQEYPDERIREIIMQRIQGKTLEETAEQMDLTRERIRQLEKKFWRRVDQSTVAFVEDKYIPLLEKYVIEAKEFRVIFGEPHEVWYIASKRCHKKDELLSLEKAVDDIELSDDIRSAIQAFYQSIDGETYLEIEGIKIPANRTDIELYMLSRYCCDEMPFDNFIDIHNRALIAAGYNNERFLITETVKYYRRNAIYDNPNVLCSFKRGIRYYPIEKYNMPAFINALQLDSFHDIEISARKLIIDHPELMEAYDIRNEHELHNLLRKQKVDSIIPDMELGKMPMIRFGDTNRTDFILDLLFALAPISKEAFAVVVSEKTGLLPEQVFSKVEYSNAIDVYLHDGMLTIDSEEMPDQEKEALLNALSDDCYTLEEIRRAYKRVTGNSDTQLISPYNLKRMGFKVFSGYVIRNFESSKAYFQHLLTCSEVVDYSAYAKRYTRISEWNETLNKLKDSFEIVEFAPYQLITKKRLEKFGVSTASLHAFCEEVYQFVEPEQYFTIYSLRKKGFHSMLFELGFEDWFYSSILREDSRLGNTRLDYSQNAVLLFCADVLPVTRQSFVEYLLKGGSMDWDELRKMVQEEYGFAMDRNDIYNITEKTDMYYDSTMGKIYANKELYYEEV